MTSSGTVLSFCRPKQWTERDWTQQELAEFYRVEAALIRSGLLVDVERGISDEGDPWFVFCRRDTGEVIAHFARIRDQYVIASSAFAVVARGKDFALLVSELMQSYPTPLPRNVRQAQNVYLHPAAMLVALLATAFIISSDNEGHDHQSSHSLTKDVARLLSLGEFAILSAVAIATTWLEQQIETGLKLLEGEHTSDSPQSAATDHGHANNEFVGAILTLFKFDSDLASHNISVALSPAMAPLVSPENQHQANTIVPVQPHGPTFSVQPNVVEKILDVSASISSPGSAADVSHAGSSLLAGADGFIIVQTGVPDPVSVSAPAQVTHVVMPPKDQVIGQATTPSSPTTPPQTSTDASHTAATDLSSTNNVPVVSVSKSSLETSLQNAPVKLQSAGGHQQAPAAESANSIAPANPTDAHPTSSPPAFDAHANAVVLDFVSGTPNLQENIAGQHVTLVDNNPADVASSHFGSLSWTFGDGSTLTIVGIMPASAQGGMHATG